MLLLPPPCTPLVSTLILMHDLSHCLLQKWGESQSLLYVCRQLWGLSIIAPIYTLLLHQWLLLHKGAGGADQRQKHVSVVISGTHAAIDRSLPECKADT